MDTFGQIAQQVVNGISLGSIYALIALGYTMVYGIVRLINFAHGDILMIGAFAGMYGLRWMGLDPLGYLFAFVFAMALCAIAGVAIERLAYRRLRMAPRINSLITAIGVSIFIENMARLLRGVVGPNPYPFPIPPADSLRRIEFEGFRVGAIQLFVIAISFLLMLGLSLLVNRTKTGRAMRAVSFDMKASALMGVNVNRIIAFTFAIGAALAAAAGILYASAYPQIDAYMGIMPGLKAFVAAVLGGIGSIPGAMLGGLILGVAETFTKGFISSSLADAISFGLLILILLAKPSGIMGKTVKEKV